jgi:hypothetical protein
MGGFALVCLNVDSTFILKLFVDFSFNSLPRPLLSLLNFKYWNIGNVITIRLPTKVDMVPAGGGVSAPTHCFSSP